MDEKNLEKDDQEQILKDFVEKEEKIVSPPNQPKNTQIGPDITIIPDTKVPWEKDNYSVANQIGWIPLPIKDLPTKGLFYPKDTVVAIRSATGAEIRHWSTLQENDLSALDDMLNYVIERCVTIKNAEDKAIRMSWKDIKEIDRFYIILAIQELTFVNGENKLQVNVSEAKKVDVKKEMIDYVTLDPKLMRFYDEEQRCFVLKIKGGQSIKLDLASIGVTQWLKNYINRKRDRQEPIDEDYLAFAPFIIRDWRGLTDDVYNKFAEDSYRWDIKTLSLLVQVRQLFADTINPVIRYIDEGGVEQVAPLNFQVKNIFIIPDIFSQLE